MPPKGLRHAGRYQGAESESSARPLRSETFGQLAERWEKVILPHGKDSQRDGSIIRVHLKPAFGKPALHSITPEMVQAWVSKETLEARTVHNMVITFKRVWKTARAWGYVTHDPFYGLVLPKKQEPRTYAFTLEETLAIIDEAKEPCKTLIKVAADHCVPRGPRRLCRGVPWCLGVLPGRRGNAGVGHFVCRAPLAVDRLSIRSDELTQPGIADRVWSIEELVALVEDAYRPAAKRGPYKKRAKA